MTVTVKCEQCGKSVEKYPCNLKTSKHHFCNSRCYGDWISANRGGENSPTYAKTIVTCNQCGVEFLKSPAQAKKSRHFCNHRCFARWRSKNWSGETHPGYNRVMFKCAQCGTALYRTLSQSKYARHFCNIQCRGEWQSISFVGENSRTWKGGDIDYYGPNWQRQRRRARKRDRFTCQVCSAVEKKTKTLHVHHIKPFREFGYILGENENYKQANKLSNLITLCHCCHILAENGRIAVQLPLLTFSEMSNLHKRA